MEFRDCAVVTAHPDDEIIWSGGLMLLHPDTRWKIVTLCRKSDPDRSKKFSRALEYLHASGDMGDLDDGPDQTPLSERSVQNEVMSLLPPQRFDLIVTHSIWGEYTRHLRHEEVARAVLALWRSGSIIAKEVWSFAYEDGGGKYPPRYVKDADEIIRLPEKIWQEKCGIITDIYGFSADSFEAKAAGRQEAFWRFKS